MKIINGQNFKMLVISGANNLYNHYPEIDALNVFPVPDGDTGINMNLTMSSGAKEVMNRNDESIYEISQIFSHGLLMGARGNSGAITSQIFRGISKYLKGKDEINAIQLAEAFDSGRTCAYKAVMKPVEGTILTVIRESSAHLLKKVNEKTSIEEAFAILLKEAKESLKRTPNLLPVLKEVGVVDSGGAGLVCIIEGMEKASRGKFIEKATATVLESSSSDIDTSDLKYSVELTIKLGFGKDKKVYQKNRFETVLCSNGDNLKVEEENDILNVKIDTLNPGNILNFVQKFGEFTNVKIANNILEHQEETLEQGEKTLEVVEEIEAEKDYALIATSSGDGISEMFKEIGVDYIVSGGQTMNPSTEDFVNIITKSNAKTCFLFPNNSNIILTANQASDLMKDKCNVVVLPTKTIMQGVVSAMMFTPSLDANDNFENMKEAINSVKSGSVTFAIKDTDLNGVHINKDEFMAIRETKNIINCSKNKIDALKFLVDDMIDEESSILTVLYGEDVSEDEKNIIDEYLKNKYQNIDIDIKDGNQSVYSFIVGVE